MVELKQCILCGEIMPFDRDKQHRGRKHAGVPAIDIQYNSFTDPVHFIKCKICHYTVLANETEKQYHKQRYHRHASVTLFNENEIFIDDWIKCGICMRYYVTKDMTLHYHEKHQDRIDKNGVPNFEFWNQSNALNQDTPAQQQDAEHKTDASIRQKPVSTQTNVAVSEEPIFVKCEYCGRELPPNFIDDHIQQEHVSDIEDNDEDDNDDSTSLSSHNNGNSRAIDHNPRTSYTLNDGKVPIVGRVKCEHCSKKIRLHKIEKHIQRKHPKETKTEKKLKRKISETGSVEMKPEKKSRTVSESVSLNSDDHHNHGEAEEEFYTIYVSKNELEKFLLAKRIYPKNGMFHLKDSH